MQELSFWPRFVLETVRKHWVIAGMAIRLIALNSAIRRDPAARTYSDVALTPVGDESDAALDLLNKTTGAAAAVAHLRRVAQITGG